MQAKVMGWDIGGAHLKSAIIQPPSEVIAVFQRPCQLWKGIDKLHESVQGILVEANWPVCHHAITMTGELVDLFDSREEGVERILAAMTSLLPDKELIVYGGKDGFLRIDDVNRSHYPAIASANWLASATWAAQAVSTGLFVDIGSTTTDILLLKDGEVLAEGFTDYQRLISQEMIYTGIVRTAVMAVAHSALDEGKKVGLMAEYFATMADVYRVTGELNELHDQTDTADGAPKTVSESAKRLARMIGCDYYDNEQLRWHQFANNLRYQQLAKIEVACERQLVRLQTPGSSPFIGAGIGRFLVKQIALNLGHPYIDFSSLFSGGACQNFVDLASVCAPAVAVACMSAAWESGVNR
jgi:(4-(4-[2-(gamma-L-glutamylamino)ethyl]phenoxymethyl)furan-2-yl)methanamine synthase